MRYSVFLASVFVAISVVHGEFAHMNGLIDVPLATPPDETFVSVMPSGSFALGDDPHSTAFDLTVSFSIARRGEITLSAFTSQDYALNGKMTLVQEQKMVPAVAIGVDNITYREWISSVGSGNTTGFEDDLGYAAERPREAFSVFLAATKTVKDMGLPFSVTLGIGRGRFVGRGPTSKYTNSDALFDTTHSLAFGLFGGIAMELVPGLSAIVEYDGRDGNVGLTYELPHLAFNLAFTHLEQLRSEEITPRVALGLAVKNTIMARPKLGAISGRVFDSYSQASIAASVAFLETNLESIPIEGNYHISLSPGIYQLRITSAGYRGKKFKVTVHPDDRLVLDIPMLNIAASDSLELYLAVGQSLVSEGKLLAARHQFQRALDIYPHHDLAREHLDEVDQQIAQKTADHKNLAFNLANKGLLEEAILEWKEVLALNPNDREALDSIEFLQNTMKQMEKPIPPPEQEPPRPPQRQPARAKLSAEQIEAMYDEALVHYFNEEYDAALKLLEKILDSDPGNKKAQKYLDRTKRILGL